MLCENYFSIINGYKDFFLKSRNPELYLPGTRFEHIHGLFTFDRQMRNAFLPWLLLIEAMTKAVIAHVASQHYRDNLEFYLSEDIYIGRDDVISSTIERLKALRSSRHPAIAHYRENIGTVPLWVLVNKMSFGNLSFFFSLLKSDSLKNEIAKVCRVN